MKKHLCDICGGDLCLTEVTRDGVPFTFFYKFKNPCRTFTFKEVMASIFLGRSQGDLECCSKCFNDFKSFVFRKNARFARKDADGTPKNI
jgi:hypothetical protein